MKKVIVIGGGASGMMAAIAAARAGAKVTLIEKNKQTGKKILVTGNGRCNFTNRDQTLINYRTGAPDRAERILQSFSMEETVRFFEELGIWVKDRDGYLYPNSGQASSIAEVLRLELQRLNVKVACNTEVLSIEKMEQKFAVRTEGWTYESDAVILACGSKAAPETGSTGDGYRFAEAFGHSVFSPLPALTGLCAREKDCQNLAGVRADAKVSLYIEETLSTANAGEVQFTSYGISGIPVFQISRYASRALAQGKSSVTVFADLLPAFSEEQVKERIGQRMEVCRDRKGADVLLGMFPEKLCGVLLGRAGISLKKSAKDWSWEEIGKLAEQIKELRFEITKVRGYEQAQVCTGGVPLTEINSNSMESKLVPELYLAGELLDVDGACGGYNLQWAWSSGFLAGKCAGVSKNVFLS